MDNYLIYVNLGNLNILYLKKKLARYHHVSEKLVSTSANTSLNNYSTFHTASNLVFTKCSKKVSQLCPLYDRWRDLSAPVSKFEFKFT